MSQLRPGVLGGMLMAMLMQTAASGAAAQTIAAFAAGSLRGAMIDLAQAFEKANTGSSVRFSFGASGLLKDHIVAGEHADVFASANTAHPQALAAAGLARPPQVFARNTLCVLALPGFSLQGRTLAQRLLDADVRLGMSTPKADPSGDYTFEMFDRIESTAAAPPGSAAALKAKAQQLTGGPNSPTPPAGRSVYGALLAEGRVDAFITYCTNASQARREQATLQVLAVPAAINVAADYGVALLRTATPAAQAFVDFVLAAPGQAILASHGFSPP